MIDRNQDVQRVSLEKREFWTIIGIFMPILLAIAGGMLGMWREQAVTNAILRTHEAEIIRLRDGLDRVQREVVNRRKAGE